MAGFDAAASDGAKTPMKSAVVDTKVQQTAYQKAGVNGLSDPRVTAAPKAASNRPQATAVGVREQQRAARNESPSNVKTGGTGYNAAVKKPEKSGGVGKRGSGMDFNGDGKVDIHDVLNFIVRIPALLSLPSVQAILPISIGIVGGGYNIAAWMGAAAMAKQPLAIAVLIWAAATAVEVFPIVDDLTHMSRVSKLVVASRKADLLPEIDQNVASNATTRVNDFAKSGRVFSRGQGNFVTLAVCALETVVVSNGKSLVGSGGLDIFALVFIAFVVFSVPLAFHMYRHILGRILRKEERDTVNQIIATMGNTKTVNIK